MTRLYLFQVIPPCGGIPTATGRDTALHSGFKSYPLAGVFSTQKALDTGIYVSSHTPLRGYSGIRADPKIVRERFQVIPPCGGIHYTEEEVCHRIGVSSHTPLRGYSPNLRLLFFFAIIVSSHTPLRGYSAYTACSPTSLQFQVIPPCGGIHLRGRGHCLCSEVSSHTPLRGYSHTNNQTATWHTRFKSYPLAGVF